MNLSPLHPTIFFESLRRNHQQDPPKHLGLPEGLHVAQGYILCILIIPLPLFLRFIFSPDK